MDIGVLGVAKDDVSISFNSLYHEIRCVLSQIVVFFVKGECIVCIPTTRADRQLGY